MSNFFKILMRSYNQMTRSDLPELTNFLKNNSGFQSLAWKIFHMKDNIIKKLDETILEDEGEKKKIHQMKRLNNNNNKK